MKINNQDIKKLYLKYRNNQNWEYVIKCNSIRNIRDSFCIDFEDNYLKVEIYNNNTDKVDMIIKDITGYLNN